MKYEISHVTTYRYVGAVSSAACMLRLRPRDIRGQTCLSSQLTISPKASELSELTDFFGNRTAAFRLETSHRELSIAAVSVVEIDRPAHPFPGLTPAWENVRAMAVDSRRLDADSPVHFLFESKLVSLHDAVTAYGADLFSSGRPILDAAITLMSRITHDFKYKKDATEVTTSVAEAFESRAGVCQDFAHIMISCLRGLGLPAAYVSGYIRTVAPPGQKKLEGADASHAWVSVWCGPEFGWIDLDPTNDMLISDDHIIVARGRDYSDVSPVDGVFVGSGTHDLLVNVDVNPLGI